MKRTLQKPKKTKLNGHDILAMSSEQIKRLSQFCTVENYEAMKDVYRIRDEMKAELAEVNAKLAKKEKELAEIQKETAKALELAHSPAGIMRQLEKLEAAGNSAELVTFYRRHADIINRERSLKR